MGCLNSFSRNAIYCWHHKGTNLFLSRKIIFDISIEMRWPKASASSEKDRNINPISG